MTALTHQDVKAALGSVDDKIVTDILATGASAEEFAQARAWYTNDEAPMNAGDPLAAGRVAQVMELMEAAEDSLIQNDVA